MQHLVIATRESQLAICQAEWVKQRLQFYHPQLTIALLGITTLADQRLDVSLTDIGGKGLFVKELEEALLDKRADIAVHSMKDVPMTLPKGLCLPVICEREEARDVFVAQHYHSIAELPRGAALGTASARRQTQLCALRSDLNIKPLRGNIHTRLNRLEQGDFDAIILAAAGLKRVGETKYIRSYLSIEESLPAAGQGALGIECRDDDKAIQNLISPLLHKLSYFSVTAERALCRYLNGGCQVPLGAYANIHEGVLFLRGLVANRDGTKLLRAHHQGSLDQAEHIGYIVGESLKQQGADKILQEFN
jgi:hydroxymethylbilane synthase